MAVVDKSAHTQVEAYHSIPILKVVEHQASVKQLAAERFPHSIPAEGCRHYVSSATVRELARQTSAHYACVQQHTSLSMKGH